MAPECGPWVVGAGLMPIVALLDTIRFQKSREESTKHLKLCNVVMKMQVSESRHFHLENPLPFRIVESERSSRYSCEHQDYSV